MSNEESNRLTRECLQTALIYLMSEKPLEKITVTELVKRSGVSRTAFYRNYSSKEEIILEIENQLCQVILESLSGCEHNLHQWFYGCFQAVKDNAALFRIFLQTDIPEDLIRSLTSALENLRPPHTIKEHYQILAIEGAFSSILLSWFKEGMKEDICFMADICDILIHHTSEKPYTAQKGENQ